MKSLSPYSVRNSGYGLVIKYLEFKRRMDISQIAMKWRGNFLHFLTGVTSKLDITDGSLSPVPSASKIMFLKTLVYDDLYIDIIREDYHR